MITVDDFGFHPCDPTDRSWTETLFMIFSVPEAGISGNLYTLARPNLGICHSSIEIHKGMCFHPWQIHHNDAQMHLACPENFDDFTLENGLSFKAHNARDSEFSYDSLDGKCQLKLSFEAVCDPFDPHDPEQVPSLDACCPLVFSDAIPGKDPRRGVRTQQGGLHRAWHPADGTRGIMGV